MLARPFELWLRAGAIVATTTLLNACAYAAFLAGGSLAPLLPTILASLLIATGIVSFVLARSYSLPSALGGPAGNAAAVVGAALVAVVAHDPARAVRSADVTVVLALTALFPGIAMFGLAAAKLGRAIRYFPYPVVVGFLAGTGWLLIVGAVRMGGPPAPLTVAVAITVALRLVFARSRAPAAFPVAALTSIAVVWLGLLLARVDIDGARSAGWLFSALPAAPPALLTPAALVSADWGAIGESWGAFVWVVIVVVAVSMLNGALLELETGLDERVDRDLFTVGSANVLVAVVGGFGSQVVLPTSLAAHKLAPGSRVPGYIVGCVALAAAIGSGTVLPYLPRPVFAAIIAFYGIRFLEQNVRDAARSMSRGELGIALGMLAATAFLGLQPALVIGLALACIAFISTASQFPVVRRETTLRDAHSRVERSEGERAAIDAGGARITILRLQGHLFFGSIAAVETTLQPLIDRDPRQTAIVLDFSIVGGVDASAALGFAKLARRARSRGVELIFAGVSKFQERELRGNGALAEHERLFASLDAALEAQEDRLIEKSTGAPEAEPSTPGAVHGFAAALERYVDRLSVVDGERIFAAGEPADAMYIVVAGRLAVELDGIRLRTLQAGALVGEMGLLTDTPRSADVTAVGAAELQCLTRESLVRMEREEPALLGDLQRGIVRLQAARLRSANAETLAFYV